MQVFYKNNNMKIYKNNTELSLKNAMSELILYIEPESVTLKPGETRQLTIHSTKPVDKNNIVWESFNTGLATISPTGVLVAYNKGKLQIKASYIKDSITISEAICEVNVTDGEEEGTIGTHFDRILISNEITDFKVGDDLGIVAHCLPYNLYSENTYTIESSDETIIKVSESNIITGIKEGTCNITAYDKTKTLSHTIPVTVHSNTEFVHTKVYNIELPKFNINIGETDDIQVAKTNSIGFNNLMLFCKRHGYTKAILPNGSYTIDPSIPIYMRSNVQLDLNQSTILIRPNDYVAYRAIIFKEGQYVDLFNEYDVPNKEVVGDYLNQKNVYRSDITTTQNIYSNEILVNEYPVESNPDQIINNFIKGQQIEFKTPVTFNVNKSTDSATINAKVNLIYYNDNNVVHTVDFGKLWIRSQTASTWCTEKFNHTLRTDLNYNKIKISLNIELANCTTNIYFAPGTLFNIPEDVLENSSIVNGILLGERDRKAEFFPDWNKNPSTEGCCTIIFEEGINNGISNLTVRKSPGFNMSTTIGSRANGSVGVGTYPVGYTIFEFGDLDNSGNPIDSLHVQRTKPYINIEKLGDTLELGYAQGYMGHGFLKARIVDFYFYDKDYNLIERKLGKMTFRSIKKPEGALFVKLVLHWSVKLTQGNSDFGGAVAFLTTYKPPTKNYMRNCIIEDNFSTGAALCGGHGWIIEGCTFRRNGGRMPGCDIDWEDGWEFHQDDIIRNNSFESYNGLIICAGSNFVFKNNIVKRSIVEYGRSFHMKFEGNTFGTETASDNSMFTIDSQYNVYMINNSFINGTFRNNREHSSGEYLAYSNKNRFIDINFVEMQTKHNLVSNCVFKSINKSLNINGVNIDSCDLLCENSTPALLCISKSASNCTFTNVNIRTEKELENPSVFDSCIFDNSAFQQLKATTITNSIISTNRKFSEISQSKNVQNLKILNNDIIIVGNNSLIYAYNLQGVIGQYAITGNTIEVDSGYSGYYFEPIWLATSGTPITVEVNNNSVNHDIKLTNTKGMTNEFIVFV